MTMELEFWVADGRNGEVREQVHRVAAWEILPIVERYRLREHVYIILRHSGRKRGSWIIWKRAGYTSGTYPIVGKLQESPEKENGRSTRND